MKILLMILMIIKRGLKPIAPLSFLNPALRGAEALALP